MNNELTTKEENRLRELTDKINHWIHDRFKVGEYLSEIRDSKLYKRDFDTFESFCESKFQFKKSQAYRLIEAAEFKKLPEGENIKTPTEAYNSSKSLQINKNLSHKGDKIINLDKTGFPIPDSLLEDWNRADSVGRDCLNRASQLKCMIDDGKKGDVIWAEVTQSAIAYAQNLHSFLKSLVPHAVCTSCQGRGPSKCATCKGRGFISEHYYENAIPVEIKEIRKKSLAK